MRRRLRVAAIGAVAATFFFAADSRAEMPGSGNVCLRAARAATRHAGLPPGLLAAIGIVETGRPDPMTGEMVPSPDAVDIHGKGTFFSDAREAVAYVREARASGLRRIDVGCFQIDLGFHQDAFPNLATAFDPAANARYAARFLTRLHARYGQWRPAIAAYHSANPAEGGPYAARVLATWHHGSASAGALQSDPHVLWLGRKPADLPHVIGP